jgi:hypothetical protein
MTFLLASLHAALTRGRLEPDRPHRFAADPRWPRSACWCGMAWDGRRHLGTSQAGWWPVIRVLAIVVIAVALTALVAGAVTAVLAVAGSTRLSRERGEDLERDEMDARGREDER